MVGLESIPAGFKKGLIIPVATFPSTFLNEANFREETKTRSKLCEYDGEGCLACDDPEMRNKYCDNKINQTSCGIYRTVKSFQ